MQSDLFFRSKETHGHGSKSRLAPSEPPNPTTKIGSKMGGEFTQSPKWDPKTVLTTTATHHRGENPGPQLLASVSGVAVTQRNVNGRAGDLNSTRAKVELQSSQVSLKHSLGVASSGEMPFLGCWTNSSWGVSKGIRGENCPFGAAPPILETMAQKSGTHFWALGWKQRPRPPVCPSSFTFRPPHRVLGKAEGHAQVESFRPSCGSSVRRVF